MAKDKKRGFFSWFGRGRQEEEQQKEETRVEKPGIEENSPETTGIAGIEEQPVAAEPEIEHAEAPGVPVENHPGEWDVTSTVEAAAEIEPAFEPVHEIPAQRLSHSLLPRNLLLSNWLKTLWRSRSRLPSRNMNRWLKSLSSRTLRSPLMFVRTRWMLSTIAWRKSHYRWRLTPSLHCQPLKPSRNARPKRVSLHV